MSEIRGIVYEHFRSIRAFAVAVGWDRTKASNIISGSREPRVSELVEMARVLGEPVEKLASIFLRKKSLKCDYEQ